MSLFILMRSKFLHSNLNGKRSIKNSQIFGHINSKSDLANCTRLHITSEFVFVLSLVAILVVTMQLAFVT